MFPYTLTDRTLSVFVDGKLHQTDRSSSNWDAIKEALNDPDTEADYLVALITPLQAVAQAVVDYAEITVRDGAVWYGEEYVHNALSVRMLDILREGLDLAPWLAFAQNVYANPSTYSRNELYEFLEKCDLPITPDGHFIAYKIVDEDYKDIYSHTFDNSVGSVVEMERAYVDPDRRNECSRGLHFCSKGYLGSYGTEAGTHVMLVKINPADVVSIPVDYNHAKGRCWRYEVVGEIDRADAPHANWAPVQRSWNGWSWDEQGIDDEDSEVEVPVTVVVDGDPDPELEQLLAEEEAIQTGEPYMVTKELGLLTASQFRNLLAGYGGKCSKLAEAHGIPKGTVRKWKKKLLKGNS